MALQKTVTSSSGIEVPDAYIRIDEFSSNKDNIVNAQARAYVSRDYFIQGMSPVSETVIQMKADYSEGAVNVKKQMYNYMKSLEEYKDAIDILED